VDRITINGASLNGVVSDNLVKTYATEFSNAAGLTVEGIRRFYTASLGANSTFTVNTARVKTLRHTTQLALDFTSAQPGRWLQFYYLEYTEHFKFGNSY